MPKRNSKAESLLTFEKKYPVLIKRALIYKDKIIVWSLCDRSLLAKRWRSISQIKMRIMPLKPLEGGETQQIWNHIWDISKPLSLGPEKVKLHVRMYDGISWRDS